MGLEYNLLKHSMTRDRRQKSRLKDFMFYVLGGNHCLLSTGEQLIPHMQHWANAMKRVLRRTEYPQRLQVGAW